MRSAISNQLLYLKYFSLSAVPQTVFAQTAFVSTM